MKIKYFVFVIAVMLAGCTQTADNNTSPPLSQQSNNKNIDNSQIKVQQTVPEKPKIDDPRAVEERLEKLAKGIPQVKDVNAVVFRQTAVVGIDVDEKVDRARVDIIKYSVAEALRKDPYGAHAIVTADMDLRQRLRDIRTNIKNGNPISGFANEMGEIIGRIIPQLPQDINPLQNQTNTSEHQHQK